MANTNATGITRAQADEQLIQYIRSRVNLTPEEEAFILERFTLRLIKKKHFFIQSGDLLFEQAFIVQGTMRVYYLDIKSQEHVLYFGFQDWWVGDLASIQAQTPSQLNVQALEDTWILSFTQSGIEEIFQFVPSMERMFRIMAQRTLAVLQKRFFLTVSASAEERYLELIKRHPNIEQLVAQHQIASYLGILPESLSRMKRQMIEQRKQVKP